VAVRRQAVLPVTYRDLRIEGAFRVDLIADDQVIVEIKAVEHVMPVHSAQLLSYLKLSGLGIGLLINFNVPLLKQGIRRMVHSPGTWRP
jgi:GxxExxY protein